MKTVTASQAVKIIKDNPTQNDITVEWSGDKPGSGRLRRIKINEKEGTITFKTNREELTLPYEIVKFVAC